MSVIVKVAQDPQDDRWALFSTVVDNFTFFGTWAEVEAYLAEQFGSQSHRTTLHRKRRAEQTGTSSMLGDWAFTVEDDLLANVACIEAPFASLPRANLVPLWDRYHDWQQTEDERPEPDYSDLVVPFEAPTVVSHAKGEQ